ncbi:MAG: DUF2892 domain-containing protein [Cytophagales bacterium]|nr:DUF2892 domain-containing protein [Cytophaga sp.]
MDIKSTIDQFTSGNANISHAQRIASVSSGAVLLISALRNIKNPSFMTALNAVGAGVMLYRGITGHCPVTAALTK